MKIQVPQKLNEADLKDIPEWGRLVVRGLNDTIEQLLNVASSLAFSDNFQCEYAVGFFRHGVAQNVSLKKLRNAAGGLSLGAVGAVVVGFLVQGGSTAGQARVTFWFAGAPSAPVKATCVLLQDGVAGDAAATTPVSTLIGKSSGQAHTTVATSLTNGVATVINYDTVDEDTDVAITTGAGWKFTCQKAGQYHLSASAGISLPAGGGVLLIAANVNGAEVKRGTRSSFVAAEVATGMVACDLQLAVGDFVQVTAFQNSGVALNTEAGPTQNHFSIHRILGS